MNTTYSEQLRDQHELSEDEVCQVLRDHGQLLGDYLVDLGSDLPELTDGDDLADWLGY
jgi:hypothetical protein